MAPGNNSAKLAFVQEQRCLQSRIVKQMRSCEFDGCELSVTESSNHLSDKELTEWRMISIRSAVSREFNESIRLRYGDFEFKELLMHMMESLTNSSFFSITVIP
jgi:hypothetical protein